MARVRTRKKVPETHSPETWRGSKEATTRYHQEKAQGTYYYCLVSPGSSASSSVSIGKAIEEACYDKGIPLEVYKWPSGVKVYRVKRLHEGLLEPRSIDSTNEIPYALPATEDNYSVGSFGLSYISWHFDTRGIEDQWEELPVKQATRTRTRNRRRVP